MKKMFLTLALLGSLGLVASETGEGSGNTPPPAPPVTSDAGGASCTFKKLFSFENKCASIATSVAAAAVLGQIAQSAEVVWSADKKKVGILGLGLSYNSAAQSGGWVTCKAKGDTLYGKTFGREVALNTRLRVEAPAGVLATLAGATAYATYLVFKK